MPDVLFIENDPEGRQPWVCIIERGGHRVRDAYDGREAMDLLGQRLPDLIVLFVEMPVLCDPDRGYEALLREAGRQEIPILLLSWANHSSIEEIAEILGTPYFLCGPFDLHNLFALLDKALTQRTPPSPHFDLLATAGRR